MLIVQATPDCRGVVTDSDGEVGGSRHGFQDYSVVSGSSGIGSPCKRSVVGYEHSWNSSIVKSYFLIGHKVGDGNGTMKVVGMSCAKARNGASGLRPGGCILGVSMGDSSNSREGLVENKMSR